MATKADMVKARQNAYNAGYASKKDSLAVNTYRVGSKSNTYYAYQAGRSDSEADKPACLNYEGSIKG